MHNSFSTFRFTTDSPTIIVTTNPTIYAGEPLRAKLRLSIDGVLSYIQFTNTDPVEIEVGAGTKTIELTEFPLSDDGAGGHVGIFITSVKIPNTYTYTIIDTDSPANKYCILGDSIPNGAAADPITAGYGMLLRDSGASVSFLTHGGAGISNDFAGNSTKINNTVAAISALMDGTANNKLLINAGVNDYTGNVVLASFQTMYGDLLTAIHTARPDIKIYCISPIVRSSETANGNGNTLGNFRTATASACSGKSYCNYIDGAGLMTSGGLSGDGVHPTTAGHLTIYNSLQTALAYEVVNSEVTTYTTGLTTPLSNNKKSKIDAFVTALKTGLSITNLSDAFDCLYLFSGETEESSLRNLAKNSFHCSNYGSLAFAPNLGFTGKSGVNSGLKSPFIPATNAIKYLQNNASFGVRLNNDITEVGMAFGTKYKPGNAGMCELYPKYSGNTIIRINGLTETSTANSTAVGLYHVVRPDANNMVLYKNNVATSFSSVSDGISQAPISFLSLQNGGTDTTNSEGSTNQISFGYLGRAFTSGEIAVINAAFNNYFN